MRVQVARVNFGLWDWMWILLKLRTFIRSLFNKLSQELLIIRIDGEGAECIAIARMNFRM